MTTGPQREPEIAPPHADYEVRASEPVFKGRLFTVYRENVRLPGGSEATFERLEYPAAVSIIPVVEERPGAPELVLVEQLRNSLRGTIHEIPAGMLEPGEDPLDCARRELEEETGYTARRWTHVTTLFPTPGISNVTMTYFLAEDLERVGEPALDENEWLVVRRVPLEDLIASVVDGKRADSLPPVVDGKTHVAVYYLAARRRRGSA